MSVHKTLDEFEQEAENETESPEKTYTLTNVRERYNGKKVGTARKDWVASMIRQFTEAVSCFKTGDQAYDDALRTEARRQEIEKAKEEHNAPGMPVDREPVAENLDKYSYTCNVTIGHRTDGGKQVINCYTSFKSYQILVDPSVVRWEA